VRVCSLCKVSKPGEAFALRNRDSQERQSYCKDCSRRYHRAYYLEQLEQIKETKRKMNRYKALFQCNHCGNSDPRVLVFDGTPDLKTSWTDEFVELAHREVLCANCLRIKLYKEV